MIDENIMDKSMEYIMNHLHEDLTVQEVARQFNFSEYYFNREFKKRTGESIYAFIKRQRLNQSAMEMKVNQNISITEIGEEYGYSSSNYSSAFKKAKNISPIEFRKSANLSSSNNPFQQEKVDYFNTYETYNRKIVIKELKDVKVLYERFIGNYSDLKEVWYRFMDIHKEEIVAGRMMIEKFYDDPKVVEVNQCICDLCIEVGQDCNRSDTRIIKGGKFAVYQYEGKIEEIYSTLQGIFSIWLPQSSYKMAERYGFNIYYNVNRERDFVIMELCIPIQ